MDITYGSRRVLHPSKTKWLVLLVACGAFVAAGTLMIKVAGPMPRAPFGDARFWGWCGLIFFGFGLLVSLAELISPYFSLTLSPQGFSFGTFFGTRRVEWSAVSSFHPEVMATRSWPMPPMKLIRFTFNRAYVDAMKASARSHPWGVTSGGYLPDTYGLSAEALVALLNEYRHKYGNLTS